MEGKDRYLRLYSVLTHVSSMVHTHFFFLRISVLGLEPFSQTGVHLAHTMIPSVVFGQSGEISLALMIWLSEGTFLPATAPSGVGLSSGQIKS